MRRILLDVNVVLDVLLDRTPFAASASLVWSAAQNTPSLSLNVSASSGFLSFPTTRFAT